MLASLEFRNFRGFADLKLQGLRRTNLIVGRNNSGKTSLLEGIALLCGPGQPAVLPGLFRPKFGDADQRYFRWLVRNQATPDSEAFIEMRTADGYAQKVIFLGKAQPAQNRPLVMSSGRFNAVSQNNPIVLRYRVLPVQDMAPGELVKSFAKAVKKRDGEERIESLLKSVDGRIRKVRVEPADDGIHVMVDLGLSEMVPISQVGQGIYRLVTILSEIIGEQPQVCLIDEIENGIHHSLLEQIWTGLANASEVLNVQIFATTHSQECIDAAHAAFSKREAYEFGIVQLFRVETGVQGRVLDRKQIEAANAGEIDLR